MNHHINSTPVEQFHREILRKPTPENPQPLANDTSKASTWTARLKQLSAEIRAEQGGLLLARASYALEELAEWLEAHLQGGDLVKIADALGDRMFLLLGDAVEHGLGKQLPAIFQAVAESNLSKCGSDQAGKAIKLEGYFSPERRIREILQSK